MTKQIATVGRVVHFYDHGHPNLGDGSAGPFSATVTRIGNDDGSIDLMVFAPQLPAFHVAGVKEFDPNAQKSPTPPSEGIYWVWPPKV